MSTFNLRFLCLLLLLLPSVGCKPGVQITISKAQVSKLGPITISKAQVSKLGWLTFGYQATGTSGCVATIYERVGDVDEVLSESQFGDSFNQVSDGSWTTTAVPSSVHFSVQEGDVFFMPPGSEKVLYRYAQSEWDATGFVGPKTEAVCVLSVDKLETLEEKRRGKRDRIDSLKDKMGIGPIINKKGP
jgi:hypothetical protein